MVARSFLRLFEQLRHARADVVAFERAVIHLREVVYSHHVISLICLPGSG